MAKFIDEARHKPGIYIASSHPSPIYARTAVTNGIGVWGYSVHDTGIGVMGAANNGIGVKGTSTSSWGGRGESTGSTGVFSLSTQGNGVLGSE
jgi:hypothetical protein